MKSLDRFARLVEEHLDPAVDVDAAVAYERAISKDLGGRTVLDDRPARPRQQLRLF